MSKPKTITIRIAVAVDEDGNWAASGSSHTKALDALSEAVEFCQSERTLFNRYWVTAEIPLPVVGEIKGTVEQA